jgi:hypothetical protein
MELRFVEVFCHDFGRAYGKMQRSSSRDVVADGLPLYESTGPVESSVSHLLLRPSPRFRPSVQPPSDTQKLSRTDANRVHHEAGQCQTEARGSFLV